MVSRSAVRVIACDKLAQWEREARIGAHGLKTTVEVDATQLLTKGVDLPPDATEGDRTVALQQAWARVDEGRTRADALRLVSRVLRRVLRVLGGEPIYDREAPPETVRQTRVGMFAEEVQAGEREPVRLDKGVMVEAAERHGLMQEEEHVDA